MASLSEGYAVQEIEEPVGHKFMFTSVGDQTIIKAIQYTYIQQFEDRQLYNLGFGDYDLDLKEIIDDVRSNNGDAYKIFRTVLSTIPIFFQHFPNAIITVQGSDSRLDFANKCRESCLRACETECRKSNQRISLYRNFVEKHFIELGKTYWFLGGFVKNEKIHKIELYTPNRTYDAILFFNK